MRVLVACPVYQLYSATAAAILSLDWSAGDRHLDTLFVRGDDPEASHYDRITDKFNHIRRVALDGGYDAVLTVEADMIPPPHALIALEQTGADLAYGLYCFRHEDTKGAWNVYRTMEADGSGIALWSYPSVARELWGRPIICAGVGTGCTLIRRHVLEALPFRHEGGLHHDWSLARDAEARGYRSIAHLGVPCGHIQAENRAIWPDPLEPNLSRVGPLVT